MGWDDYFMNLCNAVAKNSKCLLRQVGAVITTPDHAIVATGYNGPPRGVPHCDTINGPRGFAGGPDPATICPRRFKGYPAGEGRHLCPSVHAEENAILTAAREGWALKGCSIYINDFPCAQCLKRLIQVGIKKVFCVPRGDRALDHLQGFLLEHSELEIFQKIHKGTMPGPGEMSVTAYDY